MKWNAGEVTGDFFTRFSCSFVAMEGADKPEAMKDDDDGEEEDDDDIMIIENPNPIKKPPIVIICDLDDDDDDGDGDIEKEHSILETSKDSQDDLDKVTISNSLNSNKKEDPIWSHSTLEQSKACTADSLPEYLALELPQYVPRCQDTSCSTLLNSIKHKNEQGHENMEQMNAWYEKYKTMESTSTSQKSRYTCPECRAELSTFSMMQKHIQFRHPSSKHRYRPNHGIRLSEELTKDSSNSSGNSETITSNQPRFRLNPLPNLPIVSRTSTASNQIIKLPPLQAVLSQSTSTTVLNAKPRNNDLLTSSEGKSSSYNLTALSPLPGVRPNHIAQSSLATTRTTHTTHATCTSSVNTSKQTSLKDSNNCRPLTVVIYSPNNQRPVERYVHINSQSNSSQTDINNEGKHDEPCVVQQATESVRNCNTLVIEIPDSPLRERKEVSSRKRRRDPLLLLADEDINEQDMVTEPFVKAKRKDGDSNFNAPSTSKSYPCKIDGKIFASSSALNQHYQDKHVGVNLQLLVNDDNSIGNKVRMKRKRSKPKYTFPTRVNLHRHCTSIRETPSANPPPIDKLKSMKHIIMIDIDNWHKIFDSDLTFSPSTFVWGFHGGATLWKPPARSLLLGQLKQMDCFYLHPKCGRSKDAADFALCVQAGKLDALLPKEIPFTVLSGDTGFNELRHQLSLSKREVHIVNPHHKTIDTVLTILNSIAEK